MRSSTNSNSHDDEEVKEERKALPPITLPNGAIYTGQWKNDIRDGYGA